MNDATQDSYKLLKKIKDPHFEIDRLHNYSLSLHLGHRDFQLLITDTSSQRCMLLEDYVFYEESSSQQKLEILSQIFDDHHLLLARFWKSITFSWKNKKFSLVPAALYSEKSMSSYLRLNGPFDHDNDKIFTAYHSSGDFVNVFAGEKDIAEFIESTYQDREVTYIHQSSVLLDGALGRLAGVGPGVLLFIDRFSIHIAVYSPGKLRFYNQYPIKKFEDYFKYINLVSKELSLDFRSVPIITYGYMGQNTPHYQALKKNLSGLKMGEKPSDLKFSYVFDEILDHQYFDLFGIYMANCLT